MLSLSYTPLSLFLLFSIFFSFPLRLRIRRPWPSLARTILSYQLDVLLRFLFSFGLQSSNAKIQRERERKPETTTGPDFCIFRFVSSLVSGPVR